VVDTFWLRGALAISAVEQTRFLDRLARQLLPFPLQAQRAVREITLVEQGPGWELHAKTGWQNGPNPGVGWWVGWVEKGGRSYPLPSTSTFISARMASCASAWVAPRWSCWGFCRRPRRCHRPLALAADARPAVPSGHHDPSPRSRKRGPGRGRPARSGQGQPIRVQEQEVEAL